MKKYDNGRHGKWLSEITLTSKLVAMNHSEIVCFLRDVADLVRDTFNGDEYQDVILVLPVLQ
jgi:hypothetical protein